MPVTPWPAMPREAIRQRVLAALAENVSYRLEDVLGYPGSVLDRQVFYEAPFLDQAPFLRAYMENPNHIGCHTVAPSETIFRGSHAIELEVVALCAESILEAAPGTTDGYVSSGGTESNIQALWALRNDFRARGITPGELRVLHSEDTHYSIPKACDMLGLTGVELRVAEDTRQLRVDVLAERVDQARAEGAKAFLVVFNMGTTLFGSVDDPGPVCEVLQRSGAEFRVHVDAAFGGFIYPFTGSSNALTFANPAVASVTLDAHKMLQAPYGTGIFLARKGYMERVCTPEARYVRGSDFTVCGSRSGAQAIAVWMILQSYGSEGGAAFVGELIRRTDAFCARLDELAVPYFREPRMNVVAISASAVSPEVAERYHLVPDTHTGAPHWWKAVVMDHVQEPVLLKLASELEVTAG